MIYIYKVQKYFSTEIIIGECKNIYVYEPRIFTTIQTCNMQNYSHAHTEKESEEYTQTSY